MPKPLINRLKRAETDRKGQKRRNIHPGTPWDNHPGTSPRYTPPSQVHPATRPLAAVHGSGHAEHSLTALRHEVAEVTFLTFHLPSGNYGPTVKRYSYVTGMRPRSQESTLLTLMLTPVTPSTEGLSPLCTSLTLAEREGLSPLCTSLTRAGGEDCHRCAHPSPGQEGERLSPLCTSLTMVGR